MYVPDARKTRRDAATTESPTAGTRRPSSETNAEKPVECGVSAGLGVRGLVRSHRDVVTTWLQGVRSYKVSMGSESAPGPAMVPMGAKGCTKGMY